MYILYIALICCYLKVQDLEKEESMSWPFSPFSKSKGLRFGDPMTLTTVLRSRFKTPWTIPWTMESMRSFIYLSKIGKVYATVPQTRDGPILPSRELFLQCKRLRSTPRFRCVLNSDGPQNPLVTA